jgi:hypothetical protein
MVIGCADFQEEVSIVQAFVHAVYRGNWAVDTAVDTCIWWGLVAPAEQGDDQAVPFAGVDQQMPESQRLPAGPFRGGLMIECAHILG